MDRCDQHSEDLSYDSKTRQIKMVAACARIHQRKLNCRLQEVFIYFTTRSESQQKEVEEAGHYAYLTLPI